jgi:RNA polymerase sigma-70 factor (ECF subfamily)
VVNRAIDWARARALRRELDIEPPGGSEPPDDLELRDEVAAALRTLSPERHAVVVLRYVLDYTPGEIAKLLDLPRGTVNSRLRRALDELAREVERD